MSPEPTFAASPAPQTKEQANDGCFEVHTTTAGLNGTCCLEPLWCCMLHAPCRQAQVEGQSPCAPPVGGHMATYNCAPPLGSNPALLGTSQRGSRQASFICTSLPNLWQLLGGVSEEACIKKNLHLFLESPCLWCSKGTCPW